MKEHIVGKRAYKEEGNRRMLHEEGGTWSELWKIDGIKIAERTASIWGKSESVSHSIMSDSLQPSGLYVARQVPLSIGFSRQEYWSGLPFPSPGDLPNPGIKPGSPALQANSLPAEPPNGWPIWGKENGKCNGKETTLCNMLAVGASEGKIKKQGKKDPTFLRHPMCGWVLSSPCLLTRLSGSSDSWPRNKSRIVPFLNGFEWKLVIKSGTTPREDTGEEPSWVYKKPPI